MSGILVFHSTVVTRNGSFRIICHGKAGDEAALADLLVAEFVAQLSGPAARGRAPLHESHRAHRAGDAGGSRSGEGIGNSGPSRRVRTGGSDARSFASDKDDEGLLLFLTDASGRLELVATSLPLMQVLTPRNSGTRWRG